MGHDRTGAAATHSPLRATANAQQSVSAPRRRALIWERTTGMDPVQLGIPSGSLQDTTIELFRRAGWSISVSSRNYVPDIDDDHVRCKLVRAPGNLALRRGRQPRRRHHRARLDARERFGRARGCGPGVLQGQLPADPVGAGGARRLTGAVRRGPGGGQDRHGAREFLKAVLQQPRHQCLRRVFVGRHGAEGRRGTGRRHRRSHGNRDHHSRARGCASSRRSPPRIRS